MTPTDKARFAEVTIRPNHNIIRRGWLVESKSTDLSLRFLTTQGHWVHDANNVNPDLGEGIWKNPNIAKQAVRSLQERHNFLTDLTTEGEDDDVIAANRPLPESHLSSDVVRPYHTDYPTLLCLGVIQHRAIEMPSMGPRVKRYRITSELRGATYQLSHGCMWYPLNNPEKVNVSKTDEWASYDDALSFFVDACKATRVAPPWLVCDAEIGKTLTDDAPPVDKLDPKGAIGATKTPFQLIPLNALAPVAEVLRLGAKKYGERNWLTSDGVGIQTYRGAILRHQAAIDRGEDIDPESGQPHWAHVAASCLIILDAELNGKLIDNRVLPETKI